MLLVAFSRAWVQNEYDEMDVATFALTSYSNEVLSVELTECSRLRVWCVGDTQPGQSEFEFADKSVV